MSADDKSRGPNSWAGTSEESALLTAQKVHALAQIVFQRLAVSWPDRAPWSGAPGSGAPRPYPGMPWQSATQAAPAQPGANAPAAAGTQPRTLFYWYP